MVSQGFWSAGGKNAQTGWSKIFILQKTINFLKNANFQGSGLCIKKIYKLRNEHIPVLPGNDGWLKKKEDRCQRAMIRQMRQRQMVNRWSRRNNKNTRSFLEPPEQYLPWTRKLENVGLHDPSVQKKGLLTTRSTIFSTGTSMMSRVWVWQTRSTSFSTGANRAAKRVEFIYLWHLWNMKARKFQIQPFLAVHQRCTELSQSKKNHSVNRGESDASYTMDPSQFIVLCLSIIKNFLNSALFWSKMDE